MDAPLSHTALPVESLYSRAAAVLDRSSRADAALTTAFVHPDDVLEHDRVRVQALASHCPLCAAFDAPWMSSWLAAYVPREALLLCAYERARLVGLAAMQRVTEAWPGGRLSVLQSLTNVESYRFDFLSGGRIDVAEHLWRALCRSGYADVICVDHIPESSPTLVAALEIARQEEWRAVVEPTFMTPWRAVSRSEPWDRGLSAKFKSNLRRRLRLLTAHGRVSFDVAPGDSPSAVETFYRLEASGWKGERGTAIARQPEVKQLYDGLIARVPAEIRIPVLSVAGRPVAAQVLRTCNRIIFLLKTAYDEAYADCAPGQLVTARVLQYGAERDMDALDFLADNAPWKTEWATGFLPHQRILLFAPTLTGRYAYWSRRGMRDQIKRIPGAVRLVRWMRGPR